MIDVDKELGRLEKDLKAIEIELSRAEGKLNNQGFVAKAPAEVISKEKSKIEEFRSRKEGILQRLQILKA
jgi:valyl-tRNA synthetase